MTFGVHVAMNMLCVAGLVMFFVCLCIRTGSADEVYLASHTREDLGADGVGHYLACDVNLFGTRHGHRSS